MNTEQDSLTSECCCDEDRSKSSNAPNKWGISNEPIVAANVSMVRIASTIDHNAKDDEYLHGIRCMSHDTRCSCSTNNDSDYFQ